MSKTLVRSKQNYMKDETIRCNKNYLKLYGLNEII